MGDYGNVNIQFLLRENHKSEDECPEDMLLCFKWCVENNMNPKWVKEEDCLNLGPGKRDVFVFEKFEGDAFAYLKQFKSVIVGPRALLSCISDGKPIPKIGSTIFTTAMRDCYVSCTSLNESEKENLGMKVTYMGGIFDAKRLLGGTTHLVAGSVLSNKYKQAIDAKIPIMTMQWVEAVWEESLKRNVHADSKDFQHLKCPPFLGLFVTSSNIARKEKEKIKAVIEANGGVFHGMLNGAVTNFLVIKGTQGEKYRFAREFKLPCVTAEWIFESARLGHAIDISLYEVKRRECSTPVDNSKADFPPDMSVLSCIDHANEPNLRSKVVDETVCSASTSILRHTPAVPVPPFPRSLDALSRLDLKAVKAAGHFLDGCKVFLIGFGADAGEKLRRVLNAGGATRFNEISDSVSHVIVGGTSLGEVELMLQSCVHRPLVVTLEWLLESIEIQGRAPEEKFLVTASKASSSNPEPPSPSLKKSLAMLRTPTVPPFVLEPAPPADEADAAAGTLIPQYLGNAAAAEPLFKVPPRRAEPREPPAPAVNETTCEGNMVDDEDSQGCDNFFEGLTFLLVGFDDEEQQLWTETVLAAGGEVVAETYRGVPDYGVVPFCGAEVRHATKEVVTDLWLESCSQSNAKVPVEYYHLPVAAPTVKPLTGFVLGFSSYTFKERDYLVLLSQVLGAASQDVFARRDNPGKQVVASTHLVCSEPGGSKYEAAIKWGLPAVSHKWLLACLRERKAVDVAPFRVTAATALSPTVVQPATKITPANQTDITKNGDMDSSADTTYLPITSTTSRGTPKVNTTLVPSTTTPNSTPPTSSKPNSTPVQSSKPNITPVPSTKLNITPLNVSTLSTSTATPSTLNRDVTPRTSTDAVPQHYGFSQETPIRFPRLGAGTPRVGGVGSTGYVGTPEMSTPDTPYGFGTIGNPSPNTRKAMKRWIDRGPDLQRKASPEHVSKKRKSTPVSVLYKRCWNKWVDQTEVTPGAKDPAQPDSTQQPISDGNGNENGNPNAAKEGAGAYTQLNQLDQLLKAGASNSSSGADDTKMTRRSSLMEAAAATAAATTRAAPDNKAVETGVKESQWSQSNDIGWEFQDRRAESREASPQVSTAGSSEPAENNTQAKSTHEGTFKVILSTMSVPDREKYKEMVQRLGGLVYDSTHFDLSATHLICSKPSRSEKMLACIASGKWVLHSSYLDESIEAGFFLQEDKFEFGNPAAECNLPALKAASIEERLASACFRWRTRLAENRTEKGAYHGMSAIVWTSAEKMDSFKRLLHAGGGTVVDARPPYSNRTSATHLFLDAKCNVEVNYQVLVNNGVLCLPLMFLNNFLVEYPTPRAEDHLLPEVASLKPVTRVTRKRK